MVLPHELTQVSRCPSAWHELFAAQPTKEVSANAPTNNGFELFAAQPAKVLAGAKVVVPACWAAIPPGTHA